MKRNLFLLFLIFIGNGMYAQYTEIINSKRPGFSESPYAIGTNVYQIETGFFYRSNKNPSLLSRPKTYGSELYFRYGKLKERLEFDLNMAYQNDEVRSPNGSSFNIDGISQMTIGAKYLLYQKEYTNKSKEIRSWKRRIAFDKKRLIPTIGVYVGVHTNFVGKDYKRDGLSYKGAVLLQNDFNDRLVLLTNLIVDDFSSENENYSYIVTMTYALNMEWSYFIENQGQYQDKFSPQYQFGTGVAYLVNENLQVDASFRSNFLDKYSNSFFGAGVAWRLDRHEDALIYKNTPTKKIKKTPGRKGFFSRLFGKKRK